MAVSARCGQGRGTVVKWQEMSRDQQRQARRITEKLWSAGVKSATASSVARHLEDAQDWQAGTLTLAELCNRTGWTPPGGAGCA